MIDAVLSIVAVAMDVRVLCILFYYAPTQSETKTFYGTAPNEVHNINYLGAGYHVLEGNPHSNSRDPGFRQSVLDIQYTDSGSGGTLLLPDSVDVRESVMCGYESDIDEIHTTEEYRNDLSEDVKVGGSYGGIGFTSSIEYKEMESEITSKHRSFVSMVAKCSAYEAFITQMAPMHRVRRDVRNRTQISVTPLFRDAVTNLPLNGSTSLYRQFIDTFGTHYVAKVVMGAKVVWIYSFERDEWNKMKKSDVDIGAGVSASFLGFSAGVSFLSQTQSAAKEKFENFKSRASQYYIGSRPPTDGRWETWAQTTARTPYPIEYELYEITDLFNNVHLPGFTPDELSLKASILSAELHDSNKILVHQHNENVTTFARGWQEYKDGFGSISGNYWIGNERLHQLTNGNSCKVRFELQSRDNQQWYWVEYSTFMVGSESTDYTLIIGGSSTGNGPTNALASSYSLNVRPFSTFDRGTQKTCAVWRKGGFWFYNQANDGSCGWASLNSNWDGFYWKYIQHTTSPFSFMLQASRMWITKETVPKMILVHQHIENDTSFERSWQEYKNGFGSLAGNFWIGNEMLYQLTYQTLYRVRFELQSRDNQQWYWVEYNTFIVASESTDYTLSIGKCTSNGATDALSAATSRSLNGRPFSTSDHGAQQRCAVIRRGGFWFYEYDPTNDDSCGFISLNTNWDGFYWKNIQQTTLPFSFMLQASRIWIMRR